MVFISRFGNTSIKEIGNSKFFLIPSSVFKDKRFPFKETDDLVLDIVGDCLRVSVYGRIR